MPFRCVVVVVVVFNSITAEGVEWYFVVLAVTTKLCFQDSVLLILLEFVANVHKYANVKKNSLKNIWRSFAMVSNIHYGSEMYILGIRILHISKG